MGENKNNEETEDEEEVLAVLKAHTGSVNVVRFSPNGKVLASGADDNTVMLWTRYESSSLTSTAFGGGGSEVWRRILLCKGHSSDVTDLTWSPDCRRVASCSIDNTICVWDVAGSWSKSARHLKPQAVLRHGSWKIVSWDPVGLYLASTSEVNRLYGELEIGKLRRRSRDCTWFSLSRTHSNDYSNTKKQVRETELLVLSKTQLESGWTCTVRLIKVLEVMLRM